MSVYTVSKFTFFPPSKNTCLSKIKNKTLPLDSHQWDRFTYRLKFCLIYIYQRYVRKVCLKKFIRRKIFYKFICSLCYLDFRRYTTLIHFIRVSNLCFFSFFYLFSVMEKWNWPILWYYIRQQNVLLPKSGEHW